MPIEVWEDLSFLLWVKAQCYISLQVWGGIKTLGRSYNQWRWARGEEPLGEEGFRDLLQSYLPIVVVQGEELVVGLCLREDVETYFP